jgi:hypothetical protein
VATDQVLAQRHRQRHLSNPDVAPAHDDCPQRATQWAHRLEPERAVADDVDRFALLYAVRVVIATERRRSRMDPGRRLLSQLRLFSSRSLRPGSS